MTIRDILYALENMRTDKYPQGIIIAEDFGVHENCNIDSNCPKAVQLRKMLVEMNITLAEIIDGYNRESPPPLMENELNFPPFSGKAKIIIADTEMEVDLTSAIRTEFYRATRNSVDQLLRQQQRLRNLGVKLHDVYTEAIKKAKSTKVLPQIEIPVADMIKYRCLVTKGEQTYLFIFPIQYKPQWIYRDKKRYACNSEDVEYLTKNIYVVFPITSQLGILRPYLITETGNKFHHYHGRAGDCWGDFDIPPVWDRNLKTLANLSYQIQAVLATINYNSMMNPHPPGMPDAYDLLSRSQCLGEEGVLRPEGEFQAEPAPRRGWGRR